VKRRDADQGRWSRPAQHRVEPAATGMPAAAGLALELASRFARLALANVAREYPNKLDHVLAGPQDVRAPRELHPAFFGSFDWHSCVHAHWLLARVLRSHPELPEADAIRAALDATLAPARLDAELAYLRRPEAVAFERPYGWAWLLKLAQELASWSDADAHRWSRDLAPLAYAFAERYAAWLAEATYPIRHGVHTNTAFALALALDYADVCDVASLRAALEAKARAWYFEDVDAPAAWEPSGADFLSPALIEAVLVRRVLDAAAFSAWLGRFLPGIARREPAALFTPVAVCNRADPYIVHLDGLNLSRAWCWGEIAAALPAGDSRVAIAAAAADAHLEAGMHGVATGQYVGDHWLATFAVLALCAQPGAAC
jgi:DUF2891 family protein